MKAPILAIVFIVVSSFAVSAQSMFDKVNDFDGDGRADYAVTRNENGLKVWHISRSTAGYAVVQWGVSSDYVSAGDYDGDGRTDPAVTRLTGTGSQYTFTTYYLNLATGAYGIGDITVTPVFGVVEISNEDYDGDGKTDLGVYQWHGVGFVTYKMSSTGTTTSTGSMDFQERTGDVTGDGAAEIVSHTPSTGSTNVRNVAQGGQFHVVFGTTLDRWVAADFDGDNKGDIAIFRPSTGDWWWLRSSDSVVNVVHFGVNGDVPVPADYDHDGKTDQAVYRPASPQSIFYVLGSTTGFSAVGFGVATDSAVTYCPSPS